MLAAAAVAGLSALAAACQAPVASPATVPAQPTTGAGGTTTPAAVATKPPAAGATQTPAVGGATPRTTAAAAATAAGTPAPPPVVKPVPKERFNAFGSNFEMRWENMAGRGDTTPAELFFIRNHTRTPRLDAATWRLKVEGAGVETPLELTYDELQKLPSTTFTRSIECAGNGRSFFESIGGQKAEGTQWKLGAIGVAEWTGVPLKEVLERAKVKRSAVSVMPEGLDDLKVRRPMPIAKAMEEDTLIVLAMNGQPLPPDHGFPARLLLPGWVGSGNVKWLGRIEVAEQPLFSPWNTDTYVLIGPEYKPEPPAKGPVLTTMKVKSALELPWPAALKPGRQTLHGRAWSPFGAIAKVEVSTDDGKSYLPAKLLQPNAARAWTRFELDWEAKPGSTTIKVRATDDKGNTQPDKVPFNQQGYLYDGIVPHPVTVA